MPEKLYAESARAQFLECVSDLRLYLHQRYGLGRGRGHSASLLVSREGAAETREGSLDSVNDPSLSSLSSPRPVVPSSAADLQNLRDILGDCRRCGLCGGRTKIVFGDGPARADVLIVGEAPGAEEDAQGKPFVGRSGQLLTKILEAIGLTRDRVYITNVVKCRPPQNRNPKSDEVSACSPFLLEQIRLVRPKLILALGTFAAQTLLERDEPIMQLRGKPYTYAGIPLIVTLHPAACLYNPGNKKYVWQDVQDIPARLAISGESS